MELQQDVQQDEDAVRLWTEQVYELLINSNPRYVFLLDSHSLVQIKRSVIHVFAHFFNNNARIYKTNRNMVESMTGTAKRIPNNEMKYGTLSVEQFIDAVLAIQEHVNPSIVKPYHMPKEQYVSSFPKQQSSASAPTSAGKIYLMVHLKNILRYWTLVS